jgi:dTDP-L-rhamnose 4-epimerase
VRVLVTGGAGFIGSHVVEALVATGADVVTLDRRPPADSPPGVDVKVADLTDASAVARAVAGVDAVSHQAARVGLGVEFGDVVDYVTDNDLGTATLLRALWASRFSGRLVVASSMVVYGEGAYRCPTHGPTRPGPRRPADLDAGRFEPPCPRCGAALDPVMIDEDAPLDPRNTYAATKLHTEHLAATYGREAGAAVTSLRYHNVYGPRMPRDTPYAGVAAIFRSALAAGRAPQVHEDGGQRRDFVHVADVARANVAALAAPPAVAGPFNVASGEVHTVAELAAAMVRAAGPGAPAPLVTGRWRRGDVRHVVASPARAAELLGFEASVGFDEGMAAFAAEGTGDGTTDG